MIIDYDYLSQEFAKCWKDKSRIYMIQHYLKTFDGTQGKEVPFQLFPRQQVLCKTLGYGNASVCTTKYRQAGITTVTAGFISCQTILADRKSPITVLIIGNTLDLAQQMLDKIKYFLLQFPMWMWGDEAIKNSKDPLSPPSNTNVIFDKCNGKEIFTKNGCKIYARSSGPNASRGISACHYLIFDETAFIENGKEVYASALPTTSSVHGKVIFVSTPNGKDTLYYETCRRAKLKGTSDWNNFDLVEMKWYQDPRYNRFLEWTKKDAETGEVLIQKEETIDKEGNVRYDDEKWSHLIDDGWNPRSPWYVTMCKQFNNDSQKIAQELDVSFLGSASNVVEPEYIEMQQKLNQRDPKYTDPMMDDTWIWKEPIPGHRYICACIPEGEKILTKAGYKNIELIRPTDVLFSKDGNFEHIVECKRRFVEGEKIVSIKLSNFYERQRFTWNHPLLSSRSQLKRWYSKTDNTTYDFNERYYEHDFSFKNAEDICVGDWVVIPNIYKNTRASDDEILGYMNGYGIGNLFREKLFWWYCGIWAAEGCIWNSNINTTHNLKEAYIHKKVFDFISLAGKQYSIKTNEEENTMNIRFSHAGIKKFLIENIGVHAKNKFISPFIKMLPEEYRREFVDGYLCGDGSIYENKRDGLMISFGSISFDFLCDLQDILFGMGIVSNISLSKSAGVFERFGRTLNCNDLYELKIGKSYTEKFFNGKSTVRHKISNCYFSKDENLIYFKVKDVQVESYSGYVYNFETETHTYVNRRCTSHNCDPSRGDAADRTAIEILDMDGVDDETGEPILEQVLEYHGKITGDDAGELIYRYANMYGEAFVVVECIGGVGDATVLMLQRLGYKNLYYDDAQLNKFTMEIEASSLKPNAEGKLPGFHSNAVRFQMLTFFANMVKTNQIKLRSKRVIAELDTWIYKGTAARIDHQDGAHDDTLTCLAMACFVMNYSMKKFIAAKEKDKVLLKSWVSSNSITASTNTHDIKVNTEISITPKRNYSMPFYTGESKKEKEDKFAPYRWLIK